MKTHGKEVEKKIPYHTRIDDANGINKVDDVACGFDDVHNSCGESFSNDEGYMEDNIKNCDAYLTNDRIPTSISDDQSLHEPELPSPITRSVGNSQVSKTLIATPFPNEMHNELISKAIGSFEGSDGHNTQDRQSDNNSNEFGSPPASSFKLSSMLATTLLQKFDNARSISEEQSVSTLAHSNVKYPDNTVSSVDTMSLPNIVSNYNHILQPSTYADNHSKDKRYTSYPFGKTQACQRKLTGNRHNSHLAGENFVMVCCDVLSLRIERLHRA